MRLYQTRDMESVAHFLATRPERSVMFTYNAGAIRIPFRHAALAFRPPPMLRAWNQNSTSAAFEYWKEASGLLDMRAFSDRVRPPECDILLYTEAPTSMRRLREHTYGNYDIVIVYRPPSWYHHEEAVRAEHPVGGAYAALDATLQGLMSVPRTGLDARAEALSTYPATERIAFNPDTVRRVLGMDKREFWRATERRKQMFMVLRPMLAPEFDSPLYDSVAAQGDVAVIRRPWPGTDIRELLRGHYLRSEGSRYVMRVSIEQNYRVLSALAQAWFEDWVELREAIDRSPEFPVPRS